MRFCFLTLMLATVAAAPATAAQPPFELHDGDRVVFLGNTLFERAQRYDYIEAALASAFPDKNVTFRNLGWSGDTVWAQSRGLFDDPAVGYQRMLDHLRKLEPTVIFLGYGGNESFAGEEGLQAFEQQLNKLLDDLKAISDPRIVICSPIRYEGHEPPARPRNADLLAYTQALRAVADARDFHFVDLFGTEHDAPKSITYNGMHADADGYRHLAARIENLLELPPRTWNVVLAADGQVQHTDGARVVNSEKTTSGVGFEVIEDRLPYPIEQSNAVRSLTIKGLPEGRYALTIDGEKVHAATAEEWAAGQPIAGGPSAAQFEALRQAIIEKNQLYFHHWRPQNFTYLFGFRKYEQGQNAPEVDEFLKLVAEQETEIAKLRVPLPHKFELVREEVQP